MEVLGSFLSDYTLQIVSMGSAILGAISGVVGSFAVLRKQSLIGDAISHAALPGIALAFLMTGVKQTEVFLLGAIISGLLATLLINVIDRNTRIKFDSAMALVLSVFFGTGLVLLTYIQKIPNANQAGLEKFIFGQASTVLKRDIYLMVIVGVILIILVALFWKELKVFAFDPLFTESIGFSTRKLNILLSGLIVVAIIIGLQTVGVILMSALLVAPGVAARQWTNKLSVMVILAAIFGAASGIIGTIISSSMTQMPTGPSIVLVISAVVVISFLFSPERGLIWRKVRELQSRKDINEDRVLISLYELSLNHADCEHCHHISNIKPIKTKGNKRVKELKAVLEHLKDKGMVAEGNTESWMITNDGTKYIANHPMRKED